MLLLALLLTLVLQAGPGAPPAPAQPQPLWAGARYTEQDRELALERGLRFIDSIASDPKYFSRWGGDMMFCFFTISNTAKSERLRTLAHTTGQAHARQWRRDNPEPPSDGPTDIYLYLEAADAADHLLGASDPNVKLRLQQAAAKYSAVDFLLFDPRREAPPANVPELCPKCNYQNARGATRCKKCHTKLTFRDPYDLWLDALIKTHAGDSYGVELGASYPEVLRWITKLRPYPSPARVDEERFDHVCYAITHVVYTLNQYHTYRLSRAWLPQEFKYLRTNIGMAEHYQDGELLGEFMDSLRAFGEDESDPEIQRGMDYLFARQNPDGSWGEVDDDDIYTRYHSTWTAVDALRQYSYQGEFLRLPEMLPLLQGKSAARRAPAAGHRAAGR